MVIGECLNICLEFGGTKSISSLENCLIGWDNSYFNISTFFFQKFCGGHGPPWTQRGSVTAQVNSKLDAYLMNTLRKSTIA